MTTTPASQAPNTDLLASLLAEFSVKPAKAKPVAKAKPQAPIRTLAQALNEKRTGYVVWEPVGRAIFLRSQICDCCGTVTQYVENEFYILRHDKSLSTWYRPEGHESRFTDKDLPLEIHNVPEPQRVTACSTCINDPMLDALLDSVNSRQLAFPF